MITKVVSIKLSGKKYTFPFLHAVGCLLQHELSLRSISCYPMHVGGTEQFGATRWSTRELLSGCLNKEINEAENNVTK